MKQLFRVSLRMLLLAGERGFSLRIKGILLRLPSRLHIVFEITGYPHFHVALKKQDEVFEVIESKDGFDRVAGREQLRVVFKSASVLWEIMTLRTSVSRAFMERRIVLKGPISLGLEITRLFELLIAYVSPELTRLWQGGAVHKGVSPTAVSKLNFSRRLLTASPALLWKKEFVLR